MTEHPPRSQPSRLAPMFVAEGTRAEDAQAAEPDAPLTDDIADVQVPAAVMASIAPAPPSPMQEQGSLIDATMRLLEGKITAWVDAQGTATMKTLERVYAQMAACLDKIAVANDHAQYQLANALDRVCETGVQLTGTPYTATVQARSPQGFPLTLTLQKRSADELVQALEGLQTWLQTQGYTAPLATAVPLVHADDLPF